MKIKSNHIHLKSKPNQARSKPKSKLNSIASQPAQPSQKPPRAGFAALRHTVTPDSPGGSPRGAPCRGPRREESAYGTMISKKNPLNILTRKFSLEPRV